ncbi:ABC-2 type transport system permease protein [Saccharothrix ecbatanensis]|uniref:ABC-2 type transport system permease protein n=1 Tax=Saccharothrix ecbatanensis TaxID=1105145 RepID=A0A7W9LYI0_9PSEU|nr:ABC transporter permease [Saccharothrix ecbatanensis]MBB5800864.1 ABC-2 type transport system permease protein [Saccharothrix ecbatanensis]
MRDQLRVLKHGLIASWTMYSAFQTWKTWTFTWLSRLLVQACFYALIGRMLGSQQQVDYLLIGNVVAIMAIDATVVILLAVGERQSGTLALMVAAPSTHLTVYLGRGLVNLGSGVAASTVAFLVLPPLFGVRLPWPAAVFVPLMILIVGLSCYCYGTCVASFVLGFPSARWLALNLSYLVLMTFCGVNVPTSYWPDWLRAITSVLPMTHGLAAIRAFIAEGPASTVLMELALELCVAAGWFAVAALSFNRMVRRGRRDGTIEFSG